MIQSPALPTIELCGVRLHAINEAQCVSHVLDSLEAGEGGWALTAFLSHLRLGSWCQWLAYARP